MASQAGSSRRSMSLSNSSVGGKKKIENGGAEPMRKVSSSRSMYVLVLFSSYITFANYI